MHKIRQLEKYEIPQVNHILSRAFTQGRKDDGYQNIHIPLCHPRFLEMYLDETPEGCLVITDDEHLLGVSFSHVWGKTGWIGPLAISPDFHLSGMGTRIMAETVNYLKYCGCTTIGLETNPRSMRNIAFYGKLGFQAQSLTADFIRPVPLQPDDSDQPFKLIFFSECNETDQAIFLKLVNKLVSPLVSNVKFDPLIRGLTNYNFGDSILFINQNNPLAYCSFQTKSTAIEEEHYILRTISFAGHPDLDREILQFMIAALESIARNRELDQLLFRVPFTNQKFVNLFLNTGFRIIHTDQRMTLANYPEIVAPGALYFSRWV